ncbi:hypothetical protein MtrunA17_Chr3g0077521 [Medicago truncatula]|uniref:Uncharacterized protein n=1 Tax=Medicago truncatula TaxID=3880 RepID=A0A396IMY9_MEDTR|nr:hypothetical protein MtrunA17_Chr3g0077521 [Medicago truncatula]
MWLILSKSLTSDKIWYICHYLTSRFYRDVLCLTTNFKMVSEPLLKSIVPSAIKFSLSADHPSFMSMNQAQQCLS